MRRVAVICVVALALVSCSKKEAGVKGPYLAKIDNTAVTQADFDREFQALPDYAQQIFTDAAGKEKFLNEIINKELLYKEAVKKGYDKGQDYIKKVEEFKKLSLVSELFEKEIMAKAKVSDQEVKDYYDKNKDDFIVAKEIKASHILVKTEDEAQKVLSRLKKGEKFEVIAKAVSIDTGSAKNGGDLGFFKKGQMVPEFERAAAALKTGETTSFPVKSPFGFHIIKVTDKKTGEAIPYDKVRDLVSQKLSGERQKGVFDTYMAELKKSHKVEINKEALTAKPVPAKTDKQEAPAKPEEKKAEPKKEEPKK
ncbi:MAG: peptidylprolyl isomerase [Nitrospirae bacterium]|nr:peptidylprolyl isomerase [Nitrospirota bacterium]